MKNFFFAIAPFVTSSFSSLALAHPQTFNAKIVCKDSGNSEIVTFYTDKHVSRLDPFGRTITDDCAYTYRLECVRDSYANRDNISKNFASALTAQSKGYLQGCFANQVREPKTVPEPKTVLTPQHKVDPNSNFTQVPETKAPSFFEGLVTGAKFLGTLILKYGDVFLKAGAIAAILFLAGLGISSIIASWGTSTIQSTMGTILGIAGLFILMVSTIFNKLDINEKTEFLRIKNSMPSISLSQVNFIIDPKKDLMTINDMQIEIVNDGKIVKATVTKIGSEKSIFDFMNGAEVVLDRGNGHVTNESEGVCTSGHIDPNGKIISDGGC